MTNLKQVHNDQSGKVTDKWELYLREYDRVLSQYRNDEISLLEIGIQNGGSLEVWERYFPKAKNIIGCDIDPKCADLKFKSDKIDVVVGDANKKSTKNSIAGISSNFDIIIDDGSHKSSDIIHSFCEYFPLLNRGGIYIAEDLHCSYWEEFEGGLYAELSSINFFKRLVDIVHSEHWAEEGQELDPLQQFINVHGLDISTKFLAEIHSIQFINSVVVIKKSSKSLNQLGRRYISGSEAVVVPPVLNMSGSNQKDLRKSFTVSSSISPEKRIIELQNIIEKLHEQDNKQAIFLEEMQLENERLTSSLNEIKLNETRLKEALASSKSHEKKLKNELAEALQDCYSYKKQESQLRATIESGTRKMKQHKDKELALNEQLKEAEEKLSRLHYIENEIQSAESIHQREISNLNDKLEQAIKITEELRGESESSKASIERLQQEIAQYQSTHVAIKSSLSWRITAPLRALASPILKTCKFCETMLYTSRQMGGLSKTFKHSIKLLKTGGIKRLKEGYQTAQYAQHLPHHQAKQDLDEHSYSNWVAIFDTLDEKGMSCLAEQLDGFDNKPLLSIVMPTYNPDLNWLEQAVDSLFSQVYENWELCIADDCSTKPKVKSFLKKLAKRDNRIKITLRKENGHISAASNSALELASGDWVVLMDQDDLLPAHALFHVVKAINENSSAKLIYSDEDKIDENGNRFDPYFKTDWNRGLFYSHNMICHLGVYRHDLVRKVGGFRKGLEGAQDYDLALRVIEHIADNEIIHISKVLYHWRTHGQSTASGAEAKPYAVEAGRKALDQHFVRTEIACSVTNTQFGYRAQYHLSEQPLVSIIIPTKNGLELVRTCVESLVDKTTYNNYEILLVDNNSDDKECLEYFSSLEKQVDCLTVIKDPQPFNYSAINNNAVKYSSGDVLVLMNNDIEVIEPDWLTEMVSQLMQKDVGAVGAKLLYPTNKVQHAGVIIGYGGVAGHAFHMFDSEAPGYMGRLNIVSEYSAVTAACLAVTKENFLKVDGLNEKNLKVAFNDVDFCLKLQSIGLRNIYTPYALLYHHESASRGYEDTPEKVERFNREADYMRDSWGQVIAHDPCYNSNLTLEKGDFSLSFPPRQ